MKIDPITRRGLDRMQDLSGERFGRLYALRPVGKIGNRGAVWFCFCSCGGTTTAVAAVLNEGLKSCGCLIREGDRSDKKRIELTRARINYVTGKLGMTWVDYMNLRECVEDGPEGTICEMHLHVGLTAHCNAPVF